MTRKKKSSKSAAEKAAGRKKISSSGSAKRKKATSTSRKSTGSGSTRSRRRSRSKDAEQTRKARRAALKPIVRNENEILLHLEDLLRQRIVGKDDAITKVANAIRIRRTKLEFRPGRPDGAFLIVGPPGVGKSEFAYAVAEVLLGDERLVVALDMADYTEEEDLEDLVVTAYPGTDEVLVEGTLTTPVRKNPNAVILFRGLEKAHPSVLRLLHHILERGTIVDAQGEVDFSGTIVFATTRMDEDELGPVAQIGFTKTSLTREEQWRKRLEERYGAELIGAFNEVLCFGSLTPQDVKLIARYKVHQVLERLKRQNRGVEVNDRIFDVFIKEEDVKKAGARYLNRTLEEKLFTPLSKFMLAHAEARSIVVDIEDGRLIISARED